MACVSTDLFTLSVTKTGSGTVAGGSIHCGETCEADFAPDSEATLTATAANGWRFTGWSGDCAGTSASCTVTMNANRTVQATFVRLFDLTVTVDVNQVSFGTDGTGIVTASPAGLVPNPCRQEDDGLTTCRGQYLEGTVVTLSRSGTADFTDWSGACTGTGGCSVTMNDHKSVRANFN